MTYDPIISVQTLTHSPSASRQLKNRRSSRQRGCDAPAPSRGRATLWAAALVLLALASGGCAYFRASPEWNPDAFAPAAVNRSWEPKEPAAQFRAPKDAWMIHGEPVVSTGDDYDLTALIDVGLRHNPATRHAWAQARASAARLGRAKSAYYPNLGFEAEIGRSQFQFPDKPQTIDVRMTSYDPEVSLTYILLDFGRREQATELARQRLIEANFSFNRKMQDVVFAVQRAFYALDAARALRRAAERNLEQAQSVVEAADRRMKLGLATKPDVLLARQIEAKAAYDLEEAKVLVSNAHADLALTVGLPANLPINITDLSNQPLPTELDVEVDRLIDDALEQRPDLAARLADIRVREAALKEARADFLPTVLVSGNLGGNFWDYTVDSGPKEHDSAFVYGAFLTLQWDLFEGFDRFNAVREARAEQEASRAELAALQLEAISSVWKAYFDYRAATKKYEYGEALLRASQDAYDSTFNSYRQGLSTIVELLTAERDLARARYTLIQTRADLLTTSAALAYARGAMRVGTLRN